LLPRDVHYDQRIKVEISIDPDGMCLLLRNPALAAVERVTVSKSKASSNFLMAQLPETPLGDIGQSAMNDSLCATALNLIAVKKELCHCTAAMGFWHPQRCRLCAKSGHSGMST